MSIRQSIDGILLLDKPIEMTSNGALQRVKRLFNAKKAGHTGSLDPIATGMLPICFGEATKFSQYLLDANKSYHVVAKLGEETTTGDREGEVISKKPITGVNLALIEQVLNRFIGNIQQIPPMFSAIKVNGRPLYELARQGIAIERKSREVTIYSISSQTLTDELLTFDVHCSKGTYIRTLVEDVGRELGCGAHVTELRRLSVGSFQNTVMYTMDALHAMSEQVGRDVLLATLLPVEAALSCYPAIKLATAAVFYLRMGQAVRATFPMASSFVRLYAEDEQFIGIGEVLPDGRVKPHRLFSKMQKPMAHVGT